MGPTSLTTPSTSPQPARRRRRLRGLVAFCCWLYLAAVLGVWLLLWWADAWWLATLAMFAPRWLLALPLAVLVPAAVFVRLRSLGLLLLAAMLIAGPVMGFCAPWHQLVQSSPGGTPFRVLTCNMHYSRGDPGPLDELVAATNPDVVAVQEWSAAAHSALGTDPAWHIHPGSRLFLASRHPIRSAVQLGHASMGKEASVMRYELDTPLGLVHLFSLHLATARQGIVDVIHDSEKGPAELQANSRRRRQQSEFVAGQAGEMQGPVLLVGDFNTPPESVFFAQVWGDYRDAYSSAGLGWGYTFFGARTMVRIDHVLAGKGWHCLRCEVGPNVGSPHRPVIAHLVWPK